MALAAGKSAAADGALVGDAANPVVVVDTFDPVVVVSLVVADDGVVDWEDVVVETGRIVTCPLLPSLTTQPAGSCVGSLHANSAHCEHDAGSVAHTCGAAHAARHFPTKLLHGTQVVETWPDTTATAVAARTAMRVVNFIFSLIFYAFCVLARNKDSQL
ncbi:hypothetical protein BC828DRAFT_381646 [Blastocladiella britannica]|nr:hypothetical protein BC828DRAFT_381646 [Blastocladiella britannica]